MKHFVLEGVPSLRHEDSSFKHVASWVSCFLGLPLKVWAFTVLTGFATTSFRPHSRLVATRVRPRTYEDQRGNYTAYLPIAPWIQRCRSLLCTSAPWQNSNSCRRPSSSPRSPQNHIVKYHRQCGSCWRFQPRSPSKVCSGTMASLS